MMLHTYGRRRDLVLLCRYSCFQLYKVYVGFDRKTPNDNLNAEDASCVSLYSVPITSCYSVLSIKR